MAWLDFVLKISALVGGGLAVLTFWRTAKVRRAEWLSNLHTKFFETKSYKDIRRALDSTDGDPKLSQLRADVTGDQNSDLVEEFVDYLNFFEFVATLRRLGQLKPNEISMLFDYYLKLLHKHEFVRAYVKNEGFEGLDDLINECVEGIE